MILVIDTGSALVLILLISELADNSGGCLMGTAYPATHLVSESLPHCYSHAPGAPLEVFGQFARFDWKNQLICPSRTLPLFCESSSYSKWLPSTPALLPLCILLSGG